MIPAGRETFHKSERLCSRKIISELFENGNVIFSPILKVVWLVYPVPTENPAMVAFTVSKKGFRKAVTRNLIKRRMREAYRKMKHDFYSFLVSGNTRVAFIVIYKVNQLADYQIIENSMREILDKLTFQIKATHLKS